MVDKPRIPSSEKRVRLLAKQWADRSDKWHGRLDVERGWVARGAALPTLLGAVASLVSALLLFLPSLRPWSMWAALVTPIMTVCVGLIGQRSTRARSHLEMGKYDQCWAIADRMAEHYEGLIALIEDGASAMDVLRQSQALEATARFGLPPDFAKALENATNAKERGRGRWRLLSRTNRSSRPRPLKMRNGSRGPS